jgi:PKD repeat protein
MILRIFTCLICFGFSGAFSQITITTAHMPKSGDTIRYSVAPISDLPDLTKTGTNYTWNFTSLDVNSQDLYQYKASGSTPYLLSFGFSAIGVKIADTIGTGQLQLKNVYNFFKNSSTGFEGVGIGFTYSSLPLPQSGKHSDPDEIYSFPLTYNSSKNTTFKVAVPIVLGILPVGNFYQQGTRSNVVDGWGKISTPYASNLDCIRVKSIINSNDSIAVTTPAINFGIPSVRVEYKWLSTSERIPILEISGTEIAGIFTPTYIRYRDNYRATSSPLAPVADFAANATTVTTLDTVKLTDLSTNALSFEWTITPNTGFQFVAGTNAQSKNPSLLFNQKGKYTIALKATNPIGNNTKTKTDYITVNEPSSVLDQTKNHFIYPNPTNGRLKIECICNAYILTNSIGQIVMSGTIIDYAIELNTDHLANGSYLLQLKDSNGNNFYEKLVKSN